MASTKKRVNYTAEEKKLLVQLVQKHKSVIENKETNAASNSDKEKVWRQLEAEFNAKNFNVFRDAASLRKQWSNMKQDTRKKAAEARRKLYKTGEGADSPDGSEQSNAVNDLVLSVVNDKSIHGLNNPFDSDVILELPDNQVVDTGLSNENEVIIINEPTIRYMETTTEVVASNDETAETPQVSSTVKTTPSTKWSARRRPKLHTTAVENAKIEVLQQQSDLIAQEKEYKRILFEMEIEHKKKIYKMEEETGKCNCFTKHNS